MELLLFSGRNLWKHRARTFFVILTISISSLVLVLLRGYLTYTYWGLGSSIIHGSGVGHFHIYKKGYLKYGEKDPASYLLSKSDQKKIMKALAGIPEVQVVSPRLNVTGLLTNGVISTMFLSSAGNPSLDGQIRYASSNNYIAGQGLDEGKPFGVAIGKGLLDTYHINVGDTITLYSPTFDGTQNAIDVTVRSVFDTGVRQLNSMMVEATLTAAAKLMNTDSITMLVVGLKEDGGQYLQWYDEDLRSFIRKIEPVVRHSGVDVELESWMDNMPYYKSVKSLYDTTYTIINTILILLVILSIANILLMSVMERTREIGTLRAMGFTKLQIARIFFYEGFWLAIIGSALGSVLGLLVGMGINFAHFQWTPPGSNQAVPVLVLIQTGDYFRVAAILVIVSIVSSSLAIIRSSRLAIIECLRVK